MNKVMFNLVPDNSIPFQYFAFGFSNSISMESNILKSHLFQDFLTNPTAKNVEVLKHFINVRAHEICSTGQGNLVLTTLFAVIGDISVR